MEVLQLEKERVAKLAQIRELIFGAQDGLLGTLGILSSMTGAFANTHITILSGVATAVAGALSMGTGGYLSSKAELQLYNAEMAKEKAYIAAHPDEEKTEMAQMLEAEGLSSSDAHTVTEILARTPNSFFSTMIQKEFGIEPSPISTPLHDSIYIATSFITCSIIPILPYIVLPVKVALPISVVLTVCTLIALGLIKAHIIRGSYVKNALELACIGSLAALGGYLLGSLLLHS